MKKDEFSREDFRRLEEADSAESEESGIPFLEIWETVKKHLKSIIGFAISLALIGLLTASSMQPVYRSTVHIIIEPEQPKVVALAPLQNASNIHYFFTTQQKIIRSRSVAEKVIKNLRLDHSPEFLEGLESGTSLLSIISSYIPESWMLIDDSPEDENRFRERMLKYFNDNLSVKRDKDSKVVVIGYDALTSQLSARTANAIADAYIEEGLEARLRIAKQASLWLTDRLAELRTKLEASELALQRFQSAEGVVDSQRQQDMISSKLSSLTEELVRAQTKRAEAEIRYNQMRKLGNDSGAFESLQAVLANPLVGRLKEEKAKLARRVSELNKRYGAKHPKMVAAKSDLMEATNMLKAEVGKVVESIRKEYEVAVANEKELMRINEMTRQDIRSSKGKEFELAKLERNVAANRQLHELFLTRFKETDVSGSSNVTNITVIDKAIAPTKPYKPKKKVITAICLAGGLMFGLMLAFLREYIDNTFKTSEDLERKLKLPVLGALPLLEEVVSGKEKPERLVLEQPRSPFTEAVNNIRTGIIFSNMDSPPKVILVTSPMASEGKTTLSSNLSLSFAQLGKTLLVDTDLRKPRVAKILGETSSRTGFTNFVSGINTLEECAIQDEVSENLYIMTSGATPPNPLEFLSSAKVTQAFEKLRSEFEYIIVDTTPSLPFSDPMVLGHIVDCIALVIRADQTTGHMAKDTLKRFSSCKVKPLGTILSHMNIRTSARYGGYYGGYYYSDYFADEDGEENNSGFSGKAAAGITALLITAITIIWWVASTGGLKSIGIDWKTPFQTSLQTKKLIAVSKTDLTRPL